MVLAQTCLFFLIVWILAFIPASLYWHLVSSAVFQDSFFFWVIDQWLVEGAAILACLAVLACLIAGRARRRDNSPAWWGAYCAWIAWVLFSGFYAVDRGLWWRSCLLFLSCGLAGYGACAVGGKTKQKFLLWGRILASAAAVVCLYGLWQYLLSFGNADATLDALAASGQVRFHQSWWSPVMHDIFARKRLTAVFGWPTLYAGFLIVTLPLTIALSFQAPKPDERRFWRLIGFFQAASLLWTLSPIAWVAALVVAALYWRVRKGSWGRVRWIGVVLGIVLIAGLVAAGRTRPLMKGSFNSRVAYVASAIRVMRDRPLLGSGFGSYAVMHGRLTGPEHAARNAHNTLLQFGAELGWVGLALFGIFLYQAWRLAAGAMRSTDALQQGMAVGVTGFFLHSVFEQTFFEPSLVVLWFLILGFLSGVAGSGAHRAEGVWAMTGALLALAAAASGFAADLSAFNGRRLSLSGDCRESLALFGKAQQLQALETRYPVEQGLALLRCSAKQSPEAAKSSQEQAVEQFKRAVILSPWSEPLWRQLGWIQWKTGRLSEALSSTETALKQDPRSKESRRQLEHLRKIADSGNDR